MSFITPDRATKKFSVCWVGAGICVREGPVSGNQEAAQIFIKYMHDIVI